MPIINDFSKKPVDLEDLVKDENNSDAFGNMTDKELAELAEKWAADTQSKYDSISGHVDIRGKRSFWSVKKSTYQERGLYVSVGHANYIARFLEVGTKAHTIVHKQGRGYVAATVRSTKGNKALSKAFTGRREALALEIEAAINKMLTDISQMNFEDASREIVKYIECYYNSERIHSGIGYNIPNVFLTILSVH